MKTLSVLNLSILLLAGSPAPPPTQPVALEGTAGPGIQSCTIGADGTLSSERVADGQGVRYILYGENGKWIGEQWALAPKWAPAGGSLLASQGSIERGDIHAMRCTLLSADELRSCGTGMHVDEGPDIALLALLITQKTILTEFQVVCTRFLGHL